MNSLIVSGKVPVALSELASENGSEGPVIELPESKLVDGYGIQLDDARRFAEDVQAALATYESGPVAPSGTVATFRPPTWATESNP